MQVPRVVAQRIARFHSSPRIADRLAYLAGKERKFAGAKPPLGRFPFFCSGCPQNTSTRVPEGSRATAGIGCHYMAIWMDRDTATYTHMGGEGVPWLGQAPFTNTPHIFANPGDGTYYHSGSLAIRAAVAAGANITYKILYNDAVAMTGGQPIEGQLTVPQITQQLAAEGVKRIVVVSDEPDKYPVDAGFAPGVETFHRERLDAVQRDLRDTPGVSVLVYDQTCAAEKRRRRKRGRFPDPQKRVFINDLVCEGCGDCSRTSNCLSVVPVETEFGRKRAIDQSSCNKDYSCVEGFCPSFVTVHGGALRRHHEAKDSDEIPPLPAPALPALAEPYNILVAGVGGTGVVTIGALLGMAAHLEGKGCSILDMTGLAQKGLIPVAAEALERAIDLNAVAVDSNRRAFRWGRWAAVERAAVERIAAPAPEGGERLSQDIDELLARHVAFLTDYQNAAYAARYQRLVRRALAVEQLKAAGASGLAEAVARNFFKLMAYKDEYEVARLYTSGEFLKKLRHRFDGDFTLEFHLAPPLLAKRDPATGHLKKGRYGPWMMPAFALLAKLKFLRGTPLDPFGRSEERRTERRLIEEHEAMLDELIVGLSPENHALAVELAGIPEQIRGYGHI